MQYQKFQGKARAEGMKEAEMEFTKQSLGKDGLRMWAAQSFFLGKEPSSRNIALAGLVKQAESDLVQEIGKRTGKKLTPEDKISIQGQSLALVNSLRFAQRWSDVSNNLVQTLDRLMPETLRAYNELPPQVQAQPLREIALYASKNLQGSEAAGRFSALSFEIANEYNRILLGGPMGGGGTPGSVEERRVIQGITEGSLPGSTLLGSLNGMRIGSQARMQSHQAGKSQILKQLDKLTGGRGGSLLSEPPSPPSMLPYMTTQQLDALPLEDLETMQREQMEFQQGAQ
jgi:hypothetical protein